MRFGGLIFALLLLPLVACKLLPEGVEQPPAAAAGQDGEETALAGGDGQSQVKPKPRPASLTSETGAALEPVVETPAPAEAVPLEPVIQKTKEQITCEKQGGSWGNVGKSGSKTCIKRTRDGGKECRKESDCDGLCLARSGTCAPVKPLFGCNEILQNDGRRVTLCVD